MSVGFLMVLLATCNHQSPCSTLYCLNQLMSFCSSCLLPITMPLSPTRGNLLVYYPQFPPPWTGCYPPMATNSLWLQRLPRGQPPYFCPRRNAKVLVPTSILFLSPKPLYFPHLVKHQCNIKNLSPSPSFH